MKLLIPKRLSQTDPKAYARLYYAQQKSFFRLKHKQYYKENREERKAYQRAYQLQVRRSKNAGKKAKGKT